LCPRTAIENGDGKTIVVSSFAKKGIAPGLQDVVCQRDPVKRVSLHLTGSFDVLGKFIVFSDPNRGT
jgi:hypothetical protein